MYTARCFACNRILKVDMPVEPPLLVICGCVNSIGIKTLDDYQREWDERDEEYKKEHGWF